MSSKKNRTWIKEIEINELFGLLNHKISFSSSDPLLILYGDNGCGKTTILNLIYHVFSPVLKGGHRTFIGNVIFKSIFITMQNGLNINLFREEAREGNYRINCRNNEETIIDWEWMPNDKKDAVEDTEYIKYCELMKEIDINILYLPANRRIDPIEGNKDNEPSQINYYLDENNNVIRKKVRKLPISLEDSIEKFKQWTQKQLIKKTNAGYKNINDLYSDIIKKIIDSTTDEDETISKDKVIEKLNSIERKNKEYQKYGLAGDFFRKDFVSLLAGLEESKLRSIGIVLKPYLDSIDVRLKSLEELQTLLSKIEKYLNYYFNMKKVIVDIGNGITIESDNRKPLDPSKLSSGERQVLLLFCDIITARDSSSLLIIDEPEISLNVKWQRTFISSILDLINKNTTHIIIATHSIEMITKYKENVVKLGMKSEKK